MSMLVDKHMAASVDSRTETNIFAIAGCSCELLNDPTRTNATASQLRSLAASSRLLDVRRKIHGFAKVIPVNTALFRARRAGHRDARENLVMASQLAEDFSQNPKKPRGRCNCEGENCLYLSLTSSAASLEVANSGFVSLGEFRAITPLQLLDLTEDEAASDDLRGYLRFRMSFSVEEVVKDVASFEAEYYTITQLIASLARLERFDGILFSSTRIPGSHVALFDASLVAFQGSTLRPVGLDDMAILVRTS